MTRRPPQPFSPEEIDILRAQVAAPVGGAICPNCDRTIDPAAPLRERRNHRTGGCVTTRKGNRI